MPASNPNPANYIRLKDDSRIYRVLSISSNGERFSLAECQTGENTTATLLDVETSINPIREILVRLSENEPVLINAADIQMIFPVLVGSEQENFKGLFQRRTGNVPVWLSENVPRGHLHQPNGSVRHFIWDYTLAEKASVVPQPTPSQPTQWDKILDEPPEPKPPLETAIIGLQESIEGIDALFRDQGDFAYKALRCIQTGLVHVRAALLELSNEQRNSSEATETHAGGDEPPPKLGP